MESLFFTQSKPIFLCASATIICSHKHHTIMSKTKFQRKGSLFCLRNLQLLPDEKKKKTQKKGMTWLITGSRHGWHRHGTMNHGQVEFFVMLGTFGTLKSDFWVLGLPDFWHFFLTALWFLKFYLLILGLKN